MTTNDSASESRLWLSKNHLVWFPVTEQQMTDLAANMDEKTMIGRTGGARILAVGMANMFAR
jgi:carbon starvation protein CstA